MSSLEKPALLAVVAYFVSTFPPVHSVVSRRFVSAPQLVGRARRPVRLDVSPRE